MQTTTTTVADTTDALTVTGAFEYIKFHGNRYVYQADIIIAAQLQPHYFLSVFDAGRDLRNASTEKILERLVNTKDLYKGIGVVNPKEGLSLEIALYLGIIQQCIFSVELPNTESWHEVGNCPKCRRVGLLLGKGKCSKCKIRIQAAAVAHQKSGERKNNAYYLNPFLVAQMETTVTMVVEEATGGDCSLDCSSRGSKSSARDHGSINSECDSVGYARAIVRMNGQVVEESELTEAQLLLKHLNEWVYNGQWDCIQGKAKSLLWMLLERGRLIEMHVTAQ
ncbi:MAG: hypothetical protein SGARI_002302, partial [Bacillariaceae sp.]